MENKYDKSTPCKSHVVDLGDILTNYWQYLNIKEIEEYTGAGVITLNSSTLEDERWLKSPEGIRELNRLRQ